MEPLAASPAPARSGSRARTRQGRARWLESARSALIAGGIGQVKIERLAASLGATTGSFYWHFKDRDALLEALLDDWRATNTAGMIEAVRAVGPDAADQFDALIEVWVHERGFSPAYDSAVRDWARASKTVATVVGAVDRERIALLKQIFLRLGYAEDRAEVRARIMYFHQVGYYALGIRDDAETRLKLRPLYVEALRDGPGKGEAASP
jgi:AcrR family transcriptional regulator